LRVSAGVTRGFGCGCWVVQGGCSAGVNDRLTRSLVRFVRLGLFGALARLGVGGGRGRSVVGVGLVAALDQGEWAGWDSSVGFGPWVSGRLGCLPKLGTDNRPGLLGWVCSVGAGSARVASAGLGRWGCRQGRSACTTGRCTRSDQTRRPVASGPSRRPGPLIRRCLASTASETGWDRLVELGPWMPGRLRLLRPGSTGERRSAGRSKRQVGT
jgi:hypothetical protein